MKLIHVRHTELPIATDYHSRRVLGIDTADVVMALVDDGEFRRAARQWTGSFAFTDGMDYLLFRVEAGELDAVFASDGEVEAEVVFLGPADGWAKVFAAVPPPYYQDLVGGAVGRHGFGVSGDLAVMSAHYAAIQRAVAVTGSAWRKGAAA